MFLSLAFGHLIPECVHGFNASGGKDLNEALPYMIVLGGYLLIFFVEKVAFDAHEILHDMQEGGHKQPDQVKSKGIEKGSDVSRQDSGGTGRSAVILLGALAVHSILEMTALGLADTFGDSALLSLSIALHQVSVNHKCQMSPSHKWNNLALVLFFFIAHNIYLPCFTHLWAPPQ